VIEITDEAKKKRTVFGIGAAKGATDVGRPIAEIPEFDVQYPENKGGKNPSADCQNGEILGEATITQNDDVG
jgi:hypothetical protein